MKATKLKTNEEKKLIWIFIFFLAKNRTLNKNLSNTIIKKRNKMKYVIYLKTFAI